LSKEILEAAKPLIFAELGRKSAVARMGRDQRDWRLTAGQWVRCIQ
jgi:hypothetical protein